MGRNCYEIFLQNITLPGVYNLSDGTAVKCLENGGTVIQHRGQYGNAEDFFARNWTDYVEGFGSPENELWLGLDKIYELTNNTNYVMELRITMEAFNGTVREANYESFRIKDGDDNYQLILGNYSGTAGDAFSYNNEMLFSTTDNDNDESSYDCAAMYGNSGWWYNDCTGSALNGLNRNDGNTGILWYSFSRSLKTATMAIYPNFDAVMVTDERCGGDGDYYDVMDCCSNSQPCGLGEGDCDNDSDCEGDLVCGQNNCGPPHSLVSSEADCCIEFASI